MQIALHAPRWSFLKTLITVLLIGMMVFMIVNLKPLSTSSPTVNSWLERVAEGFSHEAAPKGNENIYENRRATLLKACEGKSAIVPNTVRGLLAIDHQHQLIYCPIAKVASTFWKRVMQVSSGVKEGKSPFDVIGAHDNTLLTLNRLSVQDGKRLLKNYTTFLFVREPYSRLLACYIDKFFSVNPEFWEISKKMIALFRPEASRLALSCGHNVTFHEFIQYVIHTMKTGKDINNHWEPMSQTCAPCQVRYDIIGTLETINPDLEYFLRNHLQGDVQINDSEKEGQTDILNRNAQGTFQRYTQDAANCMTLTQALYRFLRKEQIRGFLPKSAKFPEAMENNPSVTVDELKSFINKAYNANDDRNERKGNRIEALLEAYSSVPMEDMIKLQKLYKDDFQIFGYDPKPKLLYSPEARKYNQKFYFQIP